LYLCGSFVCVNFFLIFRVFLCVGTSLYDIRLLLRLAMTYGRCLRLYSFLLPCATAFSYLGELFLGPLLVPSRAPTPPTHTAFVRLLAHTLPSHISFFRPHKLNVRRNFAPSLTPQELDKWVTYFLVSSIFGLLFPSDARERF